MSDISFRPAVRQNVPLLLGVAGGTGSGKTKSALRLAQGIANGASIYGIDTENGRMLIYADDHKFQHGTIDAPFRPAKYTDAIMTAEKAGAAVVIVDSASHEWYGDGGCLDWQEEIMGGQESKRLMSWIEPKRAHKKMVTRLLQLNAHVILCFRAEPKVEMIDDPDKPGKKKFVEKRSPTGLDGWIPIAEKNLPYELTASFLLMADRPGVPRPIKLPDPLRPFVPLDRPLDESVGSALAEWAAGSGRPATATPNATTSSAEVDALIERLLTLADDLDKHAEVEQAIAKKRANSTTAAFTRWLEGQIDRAQKAVGAAA